MNVQPKPVLMKSLLSFFVFFLLISFFVQGQQSLEINEKNYFSMQGLDITVFSDIYPDGHQTGVTIIQHGNRVAANGDLRLEPSPGQWSPVPKGGGQQVDLENQSITQTMWYPDSSKNRTGFNPIIYPDLNFSYQVKVQAMKEGAFQVSVHLDKPLPEEWLGKVGFHMELFPGNLFGKSWMTENNRGIFHQQPNGPSRTENQEQIALPLAKDKVLTIAPEEPLQRIMFRSNSGELSLLDGRLNHNNGWFIIREPIVKNSADGVIEWIIKPNVVKDWTYTPVVQVSQVGYHPKQEKRAIVETDPTQASPSEISLYQLTANGEQLVKKNTPKVWGEFLRYKYLTFDFSDIQKEGLYLIRYQGTKTHTFSIDKDIYTRHVWQPVLEYFLPVQMCHMRVNEKYRVWHDRCHMDDALMAPLDTNHFDGYIQGAKTLTDFEPMEPVPGLNSGGWHDAGDYDLRVESQVGTLWNLALMVEEFDLKYDATTIDFKNKMVEIHEPDGHSDALQQIEHGLASVLGGYHALGRLYRGIICPTLRQYVMLGDASAMTDNLPYDSSLKSGEKTATSSASKDDRWVFTEDNPKREMYVVSGLAAAYRALKQTNPDLANESLMTAERLFEAAVSGGKISNETIVALTELILSTNKPTYINHLTDMQEEVARNVSKSGWAVGRVMHKIKDKRFLKVVNEAIKKYQIRLSEEQKKDSPYGVPYKPNIWGAGWNIQRFGVEQYFFYKHWPAFCKKEYFINALNFILGVHPGDNTASFASGIGSRSATVAYGVNRADWSYIPGGVASGTALIRPDLPEFKVWPFFWQQGEYVMGGGSTNYMFLAMAVEKYFSEQ